MSTFQPYTVLHVQLNSEVSPGVEGDYERAYVVFWWNEIPLGDAYFDKPALLSGLPFLKKIQRAIEPALQFYQEKSGDHGGNAWADHLLQSDQPAFRKILNQLLNSWEAPLHTSLPVSVVICTRNRPEYLRRCLNSLKDMSTAPMEIVVVDNAPTDDASRKIAAGFNVVRYIREDRKGLDIARNTGVRNSSFEVVAFVDDDVQVHASWLQNVWETFEDKEVAAMTGLVLAYSLQTEAQWLFEKYWKFNRGYADKHYGPQYIKEHLHIGPPVWEIGAGANMAFRKSVFERAGYFDERLDAGAAGCNGDSEMWCRILTKNMSIQYNPRAVVMHEHRTELAVLKNQLYNYMRGFTVACLLQQQYLPAARYKRHLSLTLPKYYLQEMIKGFPYYAYRHKTLWPEIRGLWSGVLYYFSNRNKSAN